MEINKTIRIELKENKLNEIIKHNLISKNIVENTNILTFNFYYYKIGQSLFCNIFIRNKNDKYDILGEITNCVDIQLKEEDLRLIIEDYLSSKKIKVENIYKLNFIFNEEKNSYDSKLNFVFKGCIIEMEE